MIIRGMTLEREREREIVCVCVVVVVCFCLFVLVLLLLFFFSSLNGLYTTLYTCLAAVPLKSSKPKLELWVIHPRSN